MRQVLHAHAGIEPQSNVNFLQHVWGKRESSPFGASRLVLLFFAKKS
jgi:hypothetical protein